MPKTAIPQMATLGSSKSESAPIVPGGATWWSVGIQNMMLVLNFLCHDKCIGELIFI